MLENKPLACLTARARTETARLGGGWSVAGPHCRRSSDYRVRVPGAARWSNVEVYEASDARAGYAAYLARKPDVAIIDINLPGFSGLELLRRILLREPDARLVIFSMNDDPVIAARAIEAGAKGYIAKNDDPTLFAEAVKTVANGGLTCIRRWRDRSPFCGPAPTPR